MSFVICCDQYVRGSKCQPLIKLQGSRFLFFVFFFECLLKHRTTFYLRPANGVDIIFDANAGSRLVLNVQNSESNYLCFISHTVFYTRSSVCWNWRTSSGAGQVKCLQIWADFRLIWPTSRRPSNWVRISSLLSRSTFSVQSRSSVKTEATLLHLEYVELARLVMEARNHQCFSGYRNSCHT